MIAIKERIKHYFKKLFQIINLKEMGILPGHLAFFLVLTIMPLLTLVSYISSYFNLSLLDISSLATDFMPTEVSEIIFPILYNNDSVKFSLFFMLIGFFIASNGAHSIILISNTLYKIKDKGYISRRIKAILMTIMLMSIFVFSLVFLAFGDKILEFVLSINVFPNLSPAITTVFSQIKYPIGFIIIYFVIKTLYSMAPDVKIGSKNTTKGAIFTTLGWIFITGVYSYYANHLANYDLFYGGISNLIVLMVWIYIISYIFVIGIAINATEYKIALE